MILLGLRKLKTRKIIRILKKFIISFFTPFITLTLLYILRSNTNFYFENSFLFLSLVIIFHSIFGGFFSGLWTSILGIIMAFYFFMPPYKSFEIQDDEQVIEILSFLLQSIVLVSIISRINGIKNRLDRANKDIKTNQDRLYNILDSIPVYIALLNPDGEVIEQNKLLENVLGINAKNHGLSIEDVPPWKNDPESADKILNSIKEAKNGNVTYYDEVLKIVDDQNIDVTINVVPITDDEMELEYILVAAIDITARKNYEKFLQKSVQNYLKLVDSNIAGMIVGDSNGKIIHANHAFLDLVGYTYDDLVKNQLTINDLTENRKSEEQSDITLGKLISNGSLPATEHELLDSMGNKTPVLITSVVIDEKLKQYLALIIDISEQKKLERKKDEFISIASHELKTPLTTLKGYVQLLNKSFIQIMEERLNYVDVMQTQISKLNELVNDLVDVSKIEMDKLNIVKNDFNIVDLAKEVIKEVIPLGENRNLNLKTEIEKLSVSADRFRISQVFTNLLTNAIKFSTKESDINIEITKDNEFATIKVQDFGKGIPEKELKNIFKKFYQLDNQQLSKQSMGLGLYISSDIIKKHGGKMWAESAKDNGSSFFFTLPLA